MLVWEKYVPGLRAVLEKKNWPAHQLADELSPRRLYYWVETLVTDYRKKFPDRPVLTSHMFRTRAFTIAWLSGIDPRRASIANGCNVDTVMGHYVALDEQQVTDGVFARMNPKQPRADRPGE